MSTIQQIRDKNLDGNKGITMVDVVKRFLRIRDQDHVSIILMEWHMDSSGQTIGDN